MKASPQRILRAYNVTCSGDFCISMEKLDWDLDDEPDHCLNEFSTVWGAPYTGRPGQTAPPPVGDTGDSSAAC